MKIAMVILAAGFSQRMGVLKPLLPVGETSALCRAIGLGRHEKIHMISVVTGYRWEDVDAELLKCHAKNVRRIHNAHYADGMWSSVRTGIHSLPGDIDGFFLLPADLCAIHPETLEKLIAAYILSEGSEIIYPLYHGMRGHPPLIPYAFTAGIKDYGGTDGMRGYLSQFPSAEVEIDDPGMLIDMDTPEDYAALLRYLDYPTYPDENTCFHLLTQHQVPEHIVLHSRKVAEVALKISALLIRQGIEVNVPLLFSACLLHDIARIEPEHAKAGAKLLLKEGYPDTARLVRWHMDLPERFDMSDLELTVLYLSDKLCSGDRIVPLVQRFADMENRADGDPAALAGAQRRIRQAQAILEHFNAKYGIGFSDISRSTI